MKMPSSLVFLMVFLKSLAKDKRATTKNTSLLVGLVVFIPLALIAGYFGAVLVDMIGITGYLVTIVTTSLLFLVYAWVTKIRVEPVMFFTFFVLALGSTTLSSWLTDLMNVTDSLMQSVIYATTLGVVLIILSMTPKTQQKPPAAPKL